MVDESRLDRELGELLQELRVLLPGVQVLLAFLLTAPFSARFPDMTDAQRAGYFAALLCAAAATALLMAPTTYHRIRFRARDKERMLRMGNRCVLAGTVLLAASVSIALYVVTDFLFNRTASVLVAIGSAVVYAALWYLLPVARHLSDGGRRYEEGEVDQRQQDPGPGPQAAEREPSAQQ